ncbi:MAG: hypothetical protein JST54_17365 [Deltaproteobacteria bacterium]|nr:hypothetical protein [Deltaproteobacteria bacterium]
MRLSDQLRTLDAESLRVAKENAARGRRFSTISVLRVPWGFAKRYIFKAGFLDGVDGFVAAELGAMEDLLQDARLLELEEKQD